MLDTDDTNGRTTNDVPVMELENLTIAYETRTGDLVAVRDVTLKVHRGESYGLVGESGCGKSTVAYGMIGYLGSNGKVIDGRITFMGEELTNRTERELREIRGNRISMVYQDPMSSLNPVLRIGEQLTEVLTTHQHMSKREAYDACVKMLAEVHMPDPEAVMRRYPHQISGGQQQRVVIAMALLNDPALLVLDEPTTGLDVTIQAAVLDLIDELRHVRDTAIVHISHNLGVIARTCDRVGVMYAGELVEEAHVHDLFHEPHHPYTQGLIRCIPNLRATKRDSVLYPIEGRVPRPDNRPAGCVFQPRCQHARPDCSENHPTLQMVARNHLARCPYTDAILREGWQAPQELNELVQRVGADGQVLNGQQPVLFLDHLKTYYEQEDKSVLSLVGMGKKHYVKAVDDIALSVPQGATVGIVGESGCGKSTLARTIVGLESPSGGKIEFMGMDISTSVRSRGFQLMKELQMVFQNPDSTLNPSYTVGYAISRPLERFKIVPKKEVRQEVIRLLRAVKLNRTYYDRYPRQLSGGEKQRVAIARAFAGHPELVLCDEPTSALDVSVQAAVLNLLLEIQHEHDTTLVFISHDLGVIRYFCDYVAVMYLGKIMEFGPTEEIFRPPYHPYTEALLSAVPVPDPDVEQKQIRLAGTVPSALNPPSGCVFHTRCPHFLGDICVNEEPPWRSSENGHRIYCHIPLEELMAFDPVLQMERENGAIAAREREPEA